MAGYAWYQWFGDSTLVTGNPLTPTNLGETSVETSSTGESLDVSGQNFGEHVAYLGGGNMFLSGRAPGTVRYINALEGTSTLSASSNWELESGGWVRVQPGATLRKAGTHRVTWNATTTTNNGSIDLTDGELRIAAVSAVVGSGKIVLNAARRSASTAAASDAPKSASVNRSSSAAARSRPSPSSMPSIAAASSITQPPSPAPAISRSTTPSPRAAGGGLLKQGPGRLTLTGTNSCTGTTEVDEGTLILTGMTGFGGTTIGSQAALEGTGTVRDDLTVEISGIVRSTYLSVGGDYTQLDGATLGLKLSNDRRSIASLVAGTSRRWHALRPLGSWLRSRRGAGVRRLGLRYARRRLR